MTASLIDQRLAARRAHLAVLLARLESLAARVGQAVLVEDSQALVQAAGEPFLFVVAGEVKTGKSSFINALLSEEVTAVSPEPCTDRIQMISYGPERSHTEQGPLFTRVELPHPILKDVAVVDTPGVDSVIDRHQEITERFIPRSDLVLFVFSALNPYTRSAWDFLELIAGQWRRKVVLVLNQADLATAEQLTVNRQRVMDLARERGLGEPTVFVVSSLLEAREPELSGVEAVRSHIREMVTGGEHMRAKLVSLAEGAKKVLSTIQKSDALQREALEADEAQASRISSRLEAARSAALREVANLTGQVLRRYGKACEDYLGALELELSFASMLRRSVLGLFKRKSAVPALLTDMNRAFKDSLETQVDSLARDGASHLTQHLALEVSDIAHSLRELAGTKTHGRAASAGGLALAPEAGLDSLDGGPASGTLGAQREAVLRDVANGLDAFLKGGEDPARVDPLSVARMDPKAAMGGLMMLAGGLFVLSVKGVVIDVTGGVLAGAGVFLAGGVLAVSRPRLLRRLKSELAAGGERLESELNRLLTARVEEVFSGIGRLLEPFQGETAQRRATLEELEAEAKELRAQFSNALDTAPEVA